MFVGGLLVLVELVAALKVDVLVAATLGVLLAGNIIEAASVLVVEGDVSVAALVVAFAVVVVVAPGDEDVNLALLVSAINLLASFILATSSFFKSSHRLNRPAFSFLKFSFCSASWFNSSSTLAYSSWLIVNCFSFSLIISFCHVVLSLNWSASALSLYSSSRSC